MAGPLHSTTIAAVYATIATAIAIGGDLTLAALHAVLAYHYWRAGREAQH